MRTGQDAIATQTSALTTAQTAHLYGVIEHFVTETIKTAFIIAANGNLEEVTPDVLRSAMAFETFDAAGCGAHCEQAFARLTGRDLGDTRDTDVEDAEYHIEKMATFAEDALRQPSLASYVAEMTDRAVARAAEEMQDMAASDEGDGSVSEGSDGSDGSKSGDEGTESSVDFINRVNNCRSRLDANEATQGVASLVSSVLAGVNA